MKHIMVYGPFSDYFSFSTVARGYCTALKAHHIPFTVWSTGSVENPYLDAPYDTGMVDAPVALAIGYPTQVVPLLEGHDFKIMLTVCETDRIPTEWVEAANFADQVWVPSEFCKTVFEKSGVKKPVFVATHGVSAFVKSDEKLEHNRIRLLHVSGAVSFPARKGTAQLLRAMRLAQFDKPVMLDLLVPNVEDTEHAIAVAGVQHCVQVIRDVKPYGWSPDELHQLLATYHATVQPSRGEGFGLIPLETRAAGRTAILTDIEAHQTHINRADVVIPTGAMEPLQTQGNASGYAPTVTVDNIAEALIEFTANVEKYADLAQANQTTICAGWNWQTVLMSSMYRLKKIMDRYSNIASVGALSGFGKG